MKVIDLLEARRGQWRELEAVCYQLEGSPRQHAGGVVLRLGTLYRAACADLALADAYQLPPNTVNYLHQLVARAHNQLYRSRRHDWSGWWHELMYNVPRRLYHDWYLRIAFILFWGLFIGSLLLARKSPDFAKQVISEKQQDELREMYSSIAWS